jgi:tryptophan synthase alpha chain
MSGETTKRPGDRIDRTFEALRAEGRVGLMTHIVLGYPSIEASHQIVDSMVAGGVDTIEVQIPFSDPTADGPVITAACQSALEEGVRVVDALTFMREVSAKHDIPFLFMSYLNIAFSYRGGDAAGGGLRAFVRDAAEAGAAGLIIPDMPPDEDREGYPEACREVGVHPIYVVSPNSPDHRLEAVARAASGLVYATSRTGTTGKDMDLEMEELAAFLKRAHSICSLPFAVGFSISRREQIDALRGHAEMAVIGSHLIRVYEEDGLDGVKAALVGLVGP